MMLGRGVAMVLYLTGDGPSEGEDTLTIGALILTQGDLPDDWWTFYRVPDFHLYHFAH